MQRLEHAMRHKKRLRMRCSMVPHRAAAIRSLLPMQEGKLSQCARLLKNQKHSLTAVCQAKALL